MSVILRNKTTGEIKEIKVGFSWTLFLFASFLGLPLFFRRLYVWGAVFLALWIVFAVAPAMLPLEDGAAIYIFLNLVFLALGIWLGIKGNEITAKNLLENGWEFASPGSDAVQYARLKWGLPQQPISQNRHVQAATPDREAITEKVRPEQLISPVSIKPPPTQDVVYPSAPISSPVALPDSSSKSKPSNMLFGILAAVVTALFALFVGILIGTNSKSPVRNAIPTPVGRVETVSPEASSASPAVQVHQEHSFVNTVDSNAPLTNAIPSPSVKSNTTQSGAGEVGVAESQSPVVALPSATPQSIEVRRAEMVSPAHSVPPAVEASDEDSFVNTVVHWISTHNGSSLIRYTVDDRVNYFGNTRTSNNFIEQDVNGTARVRNMSKSLEIAHEFLFGALILNTQRFTHEVSNEYSEKWVGPMLYDSIDVQTERGWARFTVGYTFVNGTTSIYALVLKIL